MTTSPPSASESFERLHPKVQRWIWQQGWTQLRSAQEAAIAPVLAGDTDILIAAATASGKTEAAFLPICSALARAPGEPGFTAVYVSPLKALINDQYGRLDELCAHLEIPVARWHGDVGSQVKSGLVKNPQGILLITPESLEALFVLRGWKMPNLMASLRYVVIDELHSFLGTARGAQLQSLMHRLDLAVRRRVPRIGLSATLGDMSAAADFLRPGKGSGVTTIVSGSDGQELRLQVRGYIAAAPTLNPRARAAHELNEDAVSVDDFSSGDNLEIADHLFGTLRGTHNLVFANSRTAVETYTDLLSRRCDAAAVPNEFVPHHGNLSKDIREHTESRLRDRTQPVTAICTSTLEMGIDIGSVTSVAQLGTPPGVAALRQRLGRSGRRGDPATLRLYISEAKVEPTTHPADELRAQLVQAIATIELLLRRWYEPPQAETLHLSTLIQQILSLIAQHGGVTPADAHRTLCVKGPFAAVDAALFSAVLRDLSASTLIRQESDGLLLHGELGERVVNHYSFYAAFTAPTEYRIVTGGRTLGSLPMEQLLPQGSLLIFAGRRWRVVAIDTQAKVIEVAKSSGGHPPRFTGTGPDIHDRIRTEMRLIYESSTVPAYLDVTGQQLLDEGRQAYRRLGLRSNPFVGFGNDTLLFPFRGDTIMTTLTLALHARGFTVTRQGLALAMSDITPLAAARLLDELTETGLPDAIALAGLVPDKRIDKYDDVLSEPLLARSYAARKIDLAQTREAIQALAAYGRNAPATDIDPAPLKPAPLKRHLLCSLPMAVVDVETTSVDPSKARIVEIAIVRLNADGSPDRTYCSLVNAGDRPGPTHIHGLTQADLAGAPRFAEIAGDVANLLEGAVIVAHNAAYDTAVLSAEFARIGCAPDDLLTLCTLELSRRFGRATTSHRLGDCAEAEGLALHRWHSAEHDAQICARLLRIYLARAEAQGAQWLDEIGAVGNLPTAAWVPAPPTGHSHQRR
ncbi:hypothetical protein GCM10009555_035590 [Acrocarpospora macrocephala]|uniref:DEAD/DEAH box helicase n=1 Tax=Acrocarpospora macrocephala TaxID=150177 RepID=A0A5M3X7K8_9ACTN|nr:DEAD/DEAH box helicase [Acrocarpospora macrocephala]GES16662.1 hypothetical protein Amac_102600 [Acrocarpospora macrocephala]